MTTPNPNCHRRDLFLALICVLLGFGTVMVHSASITSWPTEFERVYLSRHAVFLLIAVAAAAVCAALPARFWFRASPYLFAGCVVLLVLVLVPGVGTRVKGAQRWLRFGSMSLQPAEVVKVALPLFLARLISVRRERPAGWLRGTVGLLMPVGIVVPLIVLQPDLGTAVFLLGGCGIVLFLGGWPIRNFLAVAATAVPACGLLFALKPYQLERIQGFLRAWSDFRQAPYQLKQSLVSLGAGGVFGVGPGKGWQKLSFLPEANTDFVFAVVGEEFGLMGTLSVLAAWLGLFLIGVRMLGRLPRSSFRFLAAFVLLVQLVLQAALNVAVVTALVPPKGISLPLLSYGGSNLVMSLVAIGIFISLTRESAGADEFDHIGERPA